jgi:FkbM family methyltransferase
MDQEYQSPFEIEPRVIVDAGANIGMSTIYFANRYPNSRIIAIEPEGSNIRILKRNCCFFPNVKIIQGALWSSSGEVSLTNHGKEPWTFAVAEGPVPDANSKVKSYSMLDILEIANADRIDLLKLDIEGAEKELFSSDSDLWLDRVSVLAIELHDRYKPGCARAFYSKLIGRDFHQEVRGENVFIQLRGHGGKHREPERGEGDGEGDHAKTTP